MIAYDADFMPSNDITTDGLEFKTNQPFFMICNMPLSGKLYFEVTIDDYYPIAAFHNIPLYFGVSREPSFGTLNADFCMGAIYYETGKDYDIQEKYNASGDNVHQSPSNIYTRIPGIGDIIGIGVDVPGNTITIYNNGKAFYSFSPQQFRLNMHTFYFCIYSDIYYEQITYDDRVTNKEKEQKFISGHINFGKVTTDFIPPGYTSIYGYYFKRTLVENSISCDMHVEVPDDVGNAVAFLDMDLTNVLDTIEDKTLRLISNSTNVNINDFHYEIYEDPAITDNLLYGANVFVNLPIPTDVKIYLEMTATRGEVANDLIGIPLSIGLSNTNTSILSRSIRFHLYHTKQMYYQYAIVENFIQNVYEVGDIATTVVPEQGKLIGIVLDLAHNQMEVYIDGVKFYTLKSMVLDFSNRMNRTYFFIHDDDMFGDSLSGSVNLGQEPFDITIPEGCTTLYEYYNRVYRQLFAEFIFCNCRMDIDNIAGFSLWADLWMDSRTERPSPEVYGNLPFLIDSFNGISDSEQHIVNDISSIELNALIAQDNNGYYPSINDFEYNINYGDDGTIVTHTVIVRQVENQTVRVLYNGTIYTDAFQAPDGSTIKVEVEAENGYIAGSPIPSSQFTLTDDMIVTANAATVKQYSVVITQSENQTIYVTCNGRGYTSSFNTTYGSTFTATVIPADGYSAGTLNITSGTITSDIAIYATPTSVLMYPITIVQGRHYTIGVLCNGIEYTKSFNAPYNATINIYVKSVDEGYVSPNIEEPIMVVKGPIVLEYSEAGEDVCTITVVGDYQGDLLINDRHGTVFAFRKGTEVTIKFTPSDGYYVDSILLEPQ